eukprot:TRINITY_DN6225_c0_g1_i2.p1 TRINITY_DN6225_c0_g1~~TRINITY_DN6225_c0_g1_i2.p1  ORF type:complete len:279 (+),score=58.43 TRINITY_DN6225_c0_g1_i2:92-838(+)
MFTDYESISLVDVQKVFDSEERFKRALVLDIMKSQRRKINPYFPLKQGVSLFTVWDFLVVEGLHRIPMIDSNSNVADVITQSMLIDFLWQNIEKFGDYFITRHVSDLKNRTEVVFYTLETSRTISAFRHMIAMGVYGLAVLNGTGKLVDNLSLRDLKRTHSDASMFLTLWNTVKLFKEKMRNEAPQTTATRNTEAGPLWVLPTDTLYSVLEKMALSHVHRVYEVDSEESMRPIGVISQTDILSLVLHP